MDPSRFGQALLAIQDLCRRIDTGLYITKQRYDSRTGGTLMEMVLDVAGWRIWLWRAVEAGVLEMAYDVWA